MFSLDPARCALLVIDAQREYFDEDGAAYTPNAAAIVEPLQRLLAAARASGATVIFLRQSLTRAVQLRASTRSWWSPRRRVARC